MGWVIEGETIASSNPGNNFYYYLMHAGKIVGLMYIRKPVVKLSD